MSKKFTPLHIELIIHYHCICKPPLNHDAPAVIEFTEELVNLGLINKDGTSGSGYRCTDKGNVFVEKICNTELPVQYWK